MEILNVSLLIFPLFCIFLLLSSYFTRFFSSNCVLNRNKQDLRQIPIIWCAKKIQFYDEYHIVKMPSTKDETPCYKRHQNHNYSMFLCTVELYIQARLIFPPSARCFSQIYTNQFTEKMWYISIGWVRRCKFRRLESTLNRFISINCQLNDKIVYLLNKIHWKLKKNASKWLFLLFQFLFIFLHFDDSFILCFMLNVTLSRFLRLAEVLVNPSLNRRILGIWNKLYRSTTF